MSLFEKSLILGSLGGMGIFSIYTLSTTQNPKNIDKNEMYYKQQKLSQQENIKILYSSMSFFYLHGFKQKDVNSFYDFYDMLQISKPNFIALQLSQKEYQEKYLKVINHPMFNQTIEKVDFYIKTKNDKELQNLKEINLKHLEKLYAINYCLKNKCQIIYAQQPDNEYKNMKQSKINLREAFRQQLEEQKGNEFLDKKSILTDQQIDDEISQIRENDFVDNLMEIMKPGFSIIPKSPYKTIIGLVDEPLIPGISEQWKNKFMSIYGHEIIDDKEEQLYQQQVEQQVADNKQ